MPVLALPHVARAVPELTRPSCLPSLLRGDEADVGLLLLSCFYGELCWGREGPDPVCLDLSGWGLGAT